MVLLKGWSGSESSTVLATAAAATKAAAAFGPASVRVSQIVTDELEPTRGKQPFGSPHAVLSKPRRVLDKVGGCRARAAVGALTRVVNEPIRFLRTPSRIGFALFGAKQIPRNTQLGNHRKQTEFIVNEHRKLGSSRSVLGNGTAEFRNAEKASWCLAGLAFTAHSQ